MTTTPNRILRGRDVHVWQWDLREGNPGAHDLSHEEQQRAGRFAIERDRMRYVHAHAGMRRILGSYLEMPARELQFATNEHGKPRLLLSGNLRQAVPGFNLSHSHDHAVLAVSAAADVGLDVEIGPLPRDVVELARSVFTHEEFSAFNVLPHEKIRDAFFCAWTRKEAALKAIGAGFSIEASAVHAGLELDRARVTIAGMDALEIDVETFVLHGDKVVSVAVSGGFDAILQFDYSFDGPADFSRTRQRRTPFGAGFQAQMAETPLQC